MPNPGSTTARGYDGNHKAERRRWLPVVADGEAYCAATECVNPHGTGRWIPPDAPWDLGHTEDRTDYTGPEHRRCNRRDGAIRRNAAALASATASTGERRALPTSEDWWG